MNSENGLGASAVLETAGVSQPRLCCGFCPNKRPGCARLLSETRTLAARMTPSSTINHAVPDAGSSVVERMRWRERAIEKA
jgi:hypothetical protein